MSDIGHNSLSKDALRQFVSRIERLEEEKRALQADIKDVYAEAKSQGFDPKIMRQVISRRRIDPMEREEQDELRALYEATFI